jgi:tetratricopeptide (TPR) repeat protein
MDVSEAGKAQINEGKEKVDSKSAPNDSITNQAEKGKLYEIDFIGTGTFRVSQLNILQKRSIEPLTNTDSLAGLSARGLHHRDIEHFRKELGESTAIVANAIRQGFRDPNSSKTSPQLFNTYFQRALALERLGQPLKAIADYNLAIKIDPNSAQARFNRAGLLQAQVIIFCIK